MKTKRKILLAVVSICLMLSMLPMIPVSATEVPPSKWDGTASMDWITAEAAQGEDTNSTAYNGNFYKVKNYAAGTTFVIDSAADLAGLAGLVNVEEHDSAHWFKNCTFYITENIDLNSAEHNWEPIGFFNKCGFSGTLVGSLDKADGTGGQITISNMKIVNSTAQTSWGGRNAGLVGTQTAGGIKNIVIDNANVTSSGSIGVFVGYVKNTASTYENCGATNSTVTGSVANIGGLFGYINVATTTVTNCSFEGTVESSMSGTEAYLGGIVGRTAAKTIIDGCSFSGTLTKSGEATQIRIGGISGRNTAKDSEIKNCTIACTISGAVYQVGGVIGSCTGGTMTISNCHVKTGSNITGSQTSAPDSLATVGGIVGITTYGITVSDCVFEGAIQNAENKAIVNSIGGILGYNYSSTAPNIKNCTFDGSINSTSSVVGGIVGKSDYKPVIIGCTVKGSLTTTHASDGLVGGIVGRAVQSFAIKECVVDSTITNVNIGRTGGIVAYADAGITVNDCVINGTITSDKYTNGSKTKGGVGGVIGYDKQGSVTITNTYIGATVSSVYAGGFIGHTRSDVGNTYTLTNCQFDGTVNADDNSGAAFVGYTYTNSTATTINITNCINTGTTKSTNAVGYASGTANSGKITITDSYSVTALGVANYQTESLWEVSGAVATKTAAELNTLVAGDDMKALWSARDNGRAPILKVAAGVAIANGAKAADSKIELVGLQKHLTENKVRLIAAVDGLDFERAGFDMHISYTKDGVTAYSKQVTELVTVCYTSYLDESGEAVDVVADRYYIIVELTGTDKLAFDSMTVSYNAFVENAGVRAYSTNGGQQAVVTAIQ